MKSFCHLPSCSCFFPLAFCPIGSESQLDWISWTRSRRAHFVADTRLEEGRAHDEMEQEPDADHPLLQYHYATRGWKNRTCYPVRAFLVTVLFGIVATVLFGVLFVKPPHVVTFGVEHPSVVSLKPFVVNSTAYADVWNPNSFAVKIKAIGGNVYYENEEEAVGKVEYQGLEVLHARSRTKIAANLLLDHFTSSNVKTAMSDCVHKGMIHTSFKGYAKFILVWKVTTSVPIELLIDVGCSLDAI